MSKYLDSTGLSYFWSKINNAKQNKIKVNPDSSYVPSSGEMIVYDGQVKIGDGYNNAADLPFAGQVEVVRL